MKCLYTETERQLYSCQSKRSVLIVDENTEDLVYYVNDTDYYKPISILKKELMWSTDHIIFNQ